MDNTPEVVADTTAPEQTATAAPVPEVASPAPDEQNTVKTFTQDEVDAMIGKRLARERRTWERDRVRIPESVATPAPVAQDQYESVEKYADALATQKAEQLLHQREMERQQSAILESYHEREEQARDKYEDFEQVAYNPSLKITTVMAQTIQASEIGPDVAYYLGTNPKEADRISRLSPFLQAKEIGKIEAKVTDSPPVRKPSNAPAPIQPVAARSSSGPAYDTTDPRSLKSMSTSDWIAAERQRQIRAWEAKHGR